MLFKTVKPSNKYKDDDIYKDIAEYVTREDRAINDWVGYVNINDPDNAGQEMYELARSFGKLKGTRIRHMLFSFNPDTEAYIKADAAFRIGYKISQYYANDYQLIYAVHENKDHLHIHMVMNAVHRFTGQKHKGKKKDYYDFQKHIKKIIKPYGLHLRVTND